MPAPNVPQTNKQTMKRSRRLAALIDELVNRIGPEQAGLATMPEDLLEKILKYAAFCCYFWLVGGLAVRFFG